MKNDTNSIPYGEWMRLCADADEEMKKTNGHTFITILKTRCDRCGRSPKQKGTCPAWVNTYSEILLRKVNEYLSSYTPLP